jgi:hypothetical protein
MTEIVIDVVAIVPGSPDDGTIGLVEHMIPPALVFRGSGQRLRELEGTEVGETHRNASLSLPARLRSTLLPHDAGTAV